MQICSNYECTNEVTTNYLKLCDSCELKRIRDHYKELAERDRKEKEERDILDKRLDKYVDGMDEWEAKGVLMDLFGSMSNSELSFHLEDQPECNELEDEDD